MYPIKNYLFGKSYLKRYYITLCFFSIMDKIPSQDMGSEILLLIDSIELKLMKRNSEVKDEKECSASHNDRNSRIE